MADSGGGSDVGTALIAIAMIGGILYTILPKNATPPIVSPATQLQTTQAPTPVPVPVQAAPATSTPADETGATY